MGPEIRPFDLTEASAILKLYSSRIIYVYCRLLLMVESRRDYTKKGKPPNPKNPKQKPQSQHQIGKWEKERRTREDRGKFLSSAQVRCLLEVIKEKPLYPAYITEIGVQRRIPVIILRKRKERDN